ncbi:uncharacterized protein LOC123809643 [Phyllostomus hastatus]|uniref:uncharacterized protein LOC123809643 n=1 Tax=Phyllostomus hastatus TaxID=9423 RepID=UPI001E680502|nr:uncharacterized protein LOC123809643 [Phyllostomus hastatus]
MHIQRSQGSVHAGVQGWLSGEGYTEMGGRGAEHLRLVLVANVLSQGARLGCGDGLRRAGLLRGEAACRKNRQGSEKRAPRAHAQSTELHQPRHLAPFQFTDVSVLGLGGMKAGNTGQGGRTQATDLPECSSPSPKRGGVSYTENADEVPLVGVSRGVLTGGTAGRLAGDYSDPRLSSTDPDEHLQNYRWRGPASCPMFSTTPPRWDAPRGGVGPRDRTERGAAEGRRFTDPLPIIPSSVEGRPGLPGDGGGPGANGASLRPAVATQSHRKCEGQRPYILRSM